MFKIVVIAFVVKSPTLSKFTFIRLVYEVFICIHYRKGIERPQSVLLQDGTFKFMYPLATSIWPFVCNSDLKLGKHLSSISCPIQNRCNGSQWKITIE